MQVGTRNHVVIFDLLAIGGSPAVTKVLGPCLESKSTLVLGFGIKEDLSRLAWSYPHQDCFKEVSNVVDLQEVWRTYAAKLRIQVKFCS